MLITLPVVRARMTESTGDHMRLTDRLLQLQQAHLERLDSLADDIAALQLQLTDAIDETQQLLDELDS